MAKSELCKSCAHTKVCMKDKNVCGDVFVAGNPMIFDNNELWEKYKEWEAKGFPCEDYLSAADMVDKERYARLLANAIIVSDALKEYQAADMVKVVRCKDCVHYKQSKVNPNRKMCWRKDVDGCLVCYDFCPTDYCSYGERRDNV